MKPEEIAEMKRLIEAEDVRDRPRWRLLDLYGYLWKYRYALLRAVEIAARLPERCCPKCTRFSECIIAMVPKEVGECQGWRVIGGGE